MFNGLAWTTWVSLYQKGKKGKGKTSLDFTKARDSEWQWHQLGHLQVCTSLRTDNHASTPLLSFLQAGCPSCRPTNSVIALKAPKIPSLPVFMYVCMCIQFDNEAAYSHHTSTAALAAGAAGGSQQSSLDEKIAKIRRLKHKTADDDDDDDNVDDDAMDVDEHSSQDEASSNTRQLEQGTRCANTVTYLLRQVSTVAN